MRIAWQFSMVTYWTSSSGMRKCGLDKMIFGIRTEKL